MPILLLLIPLLGAVTGWVIISLAFKVLFRNLIPQKREQLASGIKEIINGYLRSAAARDNGLAPAVVDKLTDAVVRTARDRTEKKVPAVVPKAIRHKIADIVEDIIRREIPVFIATLADNLQKDQGKDNDFYRWIGDRVMEYDLAQLENMVLKSREALLIKSAAAALGLVSGLIQLLIVNLAVA